MGTGAKNAVTAPAGNAGRERGNADSTTNTLKITSELAVVAGDTAVLTVRLPLSHTAMSDSQYYFSTTDILVTAGDIDTLITAT